MRFCVLGSGSSGNASLLITGGFGILIDLGLGPRTLVRCMEEVGALWDDIHAAFLTHVHGDHWNENTLALLLRRRIPLYCHASHAALLEFESVAVAGLLDAEGIRTYESERTVSLAGTVLCRPFGVKHDSGLTCGFRFEGVADWRGPGWALGYAADLGCWDTDLAQALADVDILALEFNHDEGLERSSGRPWSLIRACSATAVIFPMPRLPSCSQQCSAGQLRGRLQHLVQLHLSRQCNRPELARATAHHVCRRDSHQVEVHTAEQHRPGRWCSPGPLVANKRRPVPVLCLHQQPFLPGWGD